MTYSVSPFRIAVPDAALKDLHSRLAQTRWPGSYSGRPWGDGTDKTYLKEMVDHWRTRFSWRAKEAALNEFPHFMASLNGVEVHFIHVKGVGPQPRPLILTHGYPSSFSEFDRIISPLADPGKFGGDPADAFDVIVPSLPGYGFSQIPDQPGMTPARIAALWDRLMTLLGYRHYFMHAGDWGAFISAVAAHTYPDRVAGLHLTSMTLASVIPQNERIGDADDAAQQKLRKWQQSELGYVAIQSTKPQSLAYGLTDSPAGLAAWIVEKWQRWSDCGGDVERCFSMDRMLTTVSIYWFTGTINSAMRLYYENGRNPYPFPETECITVPTAFCFFPRDFKPTRQRAENSYNVVRWREMPRGGHFPALEQPDLLVDDIRSALRPLR